MLQKGPETEKKILLRVGLNPQLRWSTSVCLRGFDRNVEQMFTVFPLHQCIQRTVMNEQKQLSISSQHIRVPRRRAFNFAQVLFRCVLVMPSNSVIKAEFLKTFMQKVLIYEKKICSPGIWTRNLLNASQLLYLLSHMAVVFDGMLLEFSLLLRLQPAAERNPITAFTCGDKLEVGWWWVYDVRQLICRCQRFQAS